MFNELDPVLVEAFEYVSKREELDVVTDEYLMTETNVESLENELRTKLKKKYRLDPETIQYLLDCAEEKYDEMIMELEAIDSPEDIFSYEHYSKVLEIATSLSDEVEDGDSLGDLIYAVILDEYLPYGYTEQTIMNMANQAVWEIYENE